MEARVKKTIEHLLRFCRICREHTAKPMWKHLCVKKEGSLLQGEPRNHRNGVRIRVRCMREARCEVEVRKMSGYLWRVRHLDVYSNSDRCRVGHKTIKKIICIMYNVSLIINNNWFVLCLVNVFFVGCLVGILYLVLWMRMFCLVIVIVTVILIVIVIARYVNKLTITSTSS